MLINLKDLNHSLSLCWEKMFFLWHRDELKAANSIDNKDERVCFKQPVAEDKIISAVISLLKIDKQFFLLACL